MDMNLKNQLKYGIAICSVMSYCCFFSSCTSEFRDMNTNDYGVTDDMLNYDNLKVGGFITTMMRLQVTIRKHRIWPEIYSPDIWELSMINLQQIIFMT